jgi:hypothetical protein
LVKISSTGKLYATFDIRWFRNWRQRKIRNS